MSACNDILHFWTSLGRKILQKTKKKQNRTKLDFWSNIDFFSFLMNFPTQRGPKIQYIKLCRHGGANFEPSNKIPDFYA